MRSPGQFHFCPKHVRLSVIDMFIGFLSYTNDAIIENQDQDISLLDETVLDALDIRKVDRNERYLISEKNWAVIFGETGWRAETKASLLEQKSASQNFRQFDGDWGRK